MIALRGVSKTVQSGGHPLTILHPLVFDVTAGQCVAIIGPFPRSFKQASKFLR